jgi:putative restriction endonuclease
MDHVAEERLRRKNIWDKVLESGGPNGLKAEQVRRLRILAGYRGVNRDFEQHTRKIDPAGVTVGILHTGSHYDDGLAEWGMLYHYPSTKRSTVDKNEISATKNAHHLKLPIFAVIQKGKTRNIHLGWVQEWDDNQQVFLIEFEKEWQDNPSEIALPFSSDIDPLTKIQRKKRKSESPIRDSLFGFEVKKHYGTLCAMCDIAVPKLIQGAHLISVKDGGSDHVKNGLPLCANHHVAMDNGLVAIDPETLQITTRENPKELRIERKTIRHLKEIPSTACLEVVWATHKWNQPLP